VSPPFAPGSALGRQIWQSLPKVYREEDRQGHLGRYLDACGGLLDRIHETLRQRLDDTSLESCQEWLIPYFADLLDVRIVSPDLAAQRQEVANAVLWRKQQGTARSLEALAEAVLQTEVEYQEGWRRVAITPRVDSPLVPIDGESARVGNTANPSQAARHPGLPAVTPDFRRVSTALRTEPGARGSKVSRFPRRGSREAGPDRPPLPELTPMSWRHENVHGLPRVPGSYQDLTRRTPDLRDPSWKTGHHHPRRILVFARPPSGFFAASPERLVAGLDALDDRTDGDVITFRPPAGVERATIRGPVALSLPTGTTSRRYRIEDVNFIPDDAGRGGLTTSGVSIELVRVAASALDIGTVATSTGSATQPPALRARDCLFGTVTVAGHAELEYCTVLAPTALVATTLAASDCLFMGPLRRALGANALVEVVCLRYSRLTPGDLQQLPAMARGRTFRVTDAPVRFISDRFGALSSGVLHPGTRREIVGGAEDGGELGAYHHRHHALRIRALADKLDEFIPLGQTAVIVYDPSLNCAPPRPTGIVLDARGIVPARLLALQGVGYRPTETPTRERLAPGAYRLGYASGGSGFASIDFQVTADGAVDYAPALEGPLQGRESGTLIVAGVPLTIDATAFEPTQPDGGARSLTAGGLGYFDAAQPFVARVFPGPHTLQYGSGGANVAAVEYTVAASGAVTYAPALARIFEGTTPGRLNVPGLEVTVDATAFTPPRTLAMGGVGYFPTAQPLSVVVLPGVHVLLYPTGGNNQASLEYTVRVDGTVDYPDALEGMLAGRGGTSVTVRGLTVTIDATAFGRGRTLAAGGIGYFLTDGPFEAHVLPGVHTLLYNSGGGNAGLVEYTARPDGRVDYPATLDRILGGRGSTTLQVRGVALTIAADQMSAPAIALGGVGYFETDDGTALRLLPGIHQLFYNSGGGQTALVTCEVRVDGTVTYAPALEGILTGAGTATLTIAGIAIVIDARPAAVATVFIGGVGWLDTTSPVEVRLLPGTHALLYARTGGGNIEVLLNVTASGIDYPASRDGQLAGRGTRTLTINRSTEP
jgi:hypothetical protein